MTVLVTLAVVAVLGLWLLTAYDRLTRLRKQVQKAWRQVDVHLKRRHDLVARIVDTVRVELDAERETLEGVVTACDQAITATGPSDAATKEARLTEALRRLLAIIADTPRLTAALTAGALQEELALIEGKVALAGHSYNVVVTAYKFRDERRTRKTHGGLRQVPAGAIVRGQ